MPSLPLPRFLETHEERQRHAQQLAKVVREAGGDVAEERKRFHADPVDALTLRGVPCVGPGCAGGVIRGTSPEGALMSKQPRE